MRRLRCLLPAVLVLAGCTAGGEDPDLAAVRAVTMSGPRITWDELDIHPTLRARACAVSTLVDRYGTTVGYCEGRRSCRTMDWRPVEDGCRQGQQRTAGRG